METQTQTVKGSADMQLEIVRHYFRCLDCLSVFATEEKYHTDGEFPICPCGGQVHYMGPVCKTPMLSTEMESVCDGRCTNARGNSCNCVCGGHNHGTQMVIEVTRRVDINAPKIKGIDYAYGLEFRSKLASYIAHCPELDQLNHGQYIHDKGRYWNAVKVRDLLDKARYSLSKAKRANIFVEIDRRLGIQVA